MNIWISTGTVREWLVKSVQKFVEVLWMAGRKESDLSSAASLCVLTASRASSRKRALLSYINIIGRVGISDGMMDRMWLASLIQPHNRHYIVYSTTFREPLLNSQTNMQAPRGLSIMQFI
ncbi:MAG: hypothetical protein ACKESC_01555 [Candidatus Hodgkinia cicadicola]